MSRSLLALSMSLLAGCSSLGDIQGTPQALRTLDSTCKVLTGHSCGKSQINAPQLNRTVGQLQQMQYHLKHGQTPQKVSETLELLR